MTFLIGRGAGGRTRYGGAFLHLFLLLLTLRPSVGVSRIESSVTPLAYSAVGGPVLSCRIPVAGGPGGQFLLFGDLSPALPSWQGGADCRDNE